MWKAVMFAYIYANWIGIKFYDFCSVHSHSLSLVSCRSNAPSTHTYENNIIESKCECLDLPEKIEDHLFNAHSRQKSCIKCAVTLGKSGHKNITSRLNKCA